MYTVAQYTCTVHVERPFHICTWLSSQTLLCLSVCVCPVAGLSAGGADVWYPRVRQGRAQLLYVQATHYLTHWHTILVWLVYMCGSFCKATRSCSTCYIYYIHCVQTTLYLQLYFHASSKYSPSNANIHVLTVLYMRDAPGLHNLYPPSSDWWAVPVSRCVYQCQAQERPAPVSDYQEHRAKHSVDIWRQIQDASLLLPTGATGHTQQHLHYWRTAWVSLFILFKQSYERHHSFWMYMTDVHV